MFYEIHDTQNANVYCLSADMKNIKAECVRKFEIFIPKWEGRPDRHLKVVGKTVTKSLKYNFK